MTTTTSLDAAGVHQLLVGVALEERVGLDLVHRRRDLVVLDEVDKPVGIEVRDAYGPDQALPVQVLHRPPRAVIVTERLVDQAQVHVVQPSRLRDSSKAAWRCPRRRPAPTSWW